MLELYRDFYGCHAAIRTYRNGSARLTVRTPGGKIIHAKDCATRKGARIAMGRLSDCWTQK